MSSPRLSVVIPAYNEEKGLAACLAALQRQTCADFETIVVDNNSTDGTAALAERLGARVVPCAVQGIGSARNEGARQANGALVAFIDADGQMCPSWVEQALARFDADPKLDTLTGTNVFDAPGARFLPVLQRLQRHRLHRPRHGDPVAAPSGGRQQHYQPPRALSRYHRLSATGARGRPLRQNSAPARRFPVAMGAEDDHSVFVAAVSTKRLHVDPDVFGMGRGRRTPRGSISHAFLNRRGPSSR